MISEVRAEKGFSIDYGRPKIVSAALMQLKGLIDMKREIRNHLFSVQYKPLLESRNSRVYAIKLGQRILGVIKVAEDHQRAIIEEVKWNIADLLGDRDHFVPTMAWSFRDQKKMSFGEDFSGRIDPEGRFIVDRGLKKADCYAFEPFIEGSHTPVKDRQEWLKTALMGIVYGLFDGHYKNLLYNEETKRAYHIDYVQSMPPKNAPLVWGSILRPFLRLTQVSDPFAATAFSEEERTWMIERLKKYFDSLPALKAYLDAFIIRKKLSYVDKTQFDPDFSFNALRERVIKTKQFIEAGVENFRELIFKLCPFYMLQALFIHLDYARKGSEFDSKNFEEVGNCDLKTLARMLFASGVDPNDIIQDIYNAHSFDRIFNAYKEKFRLKINALPEDRFRAFCRKLKEIGQDAAFSGADLYRSRNEFLIEYYRERLKFARILFWEKNKWLYVEYQGLKLAVRPLFIHDKIHLLYKDGYLPLMSIEEFKMPPSHETKHAIDILDYCFSNRIKVVAADKMVLISKWASLKRGEFFVGQIQDKAEFILFNRKLNGKREQKKISASTDIVINREPLMEIERVNPFLALDDLKIPYRFENGVASIQIENEWFKLNAHHGFYTISLGLGELAPLSALEIKEGLEKGFANFEWLKFFAPFKFTLSDAQQDLCPIATYLIQQIRGTQDFYFYKRGACRLEEYKLEFRADHIVLKDLYGRMFRYTREEFKKLLTSI